MTLQNQSLLDIAIQDSGSVESTFLFALQNDISVTAALPTGKRLKGCAVKNKDVLYHYSARKLKPATWGGNAALGGIGYMNVEGNFIVS